MTVLTIDMLRCPFCEEKPLCHHLKDHHWVACSNCESGRLISMFTYKTESDAIEAWNDKLRFVFGEPYE